MLICGSLGLTRNALEMLGSLAPAVMPRRRNAGKFLVGEKQGDLNPRDRP
ncbi:MAG: hypothetical protein ACLT4C_00775 [Butyricicoccus sp.]